MLLRSTLEGESLYCLVGVAASTRSRAPAKSQVDATSHSLTRRLQLERTCCWLSKSLFVLRTSAGTESGSKVI